MAYSSIIVFIPVFFVNLLSSPKAEREGRYMGIQREWLNNPKFSLAKRKTG
jgi:hypothetical protein